MMEYQCCNLSWMPRCNWTAIEASGCYGNFRVRAVQAMNIAFRRAGSIYSRRIHARLTSLQEV
jgi:hypothetical protein